MLHFSRVKIFFIMGAIVLGILFSMPNVLPVGVRDNLPAPLPRNTLNLGLDLQGGAHFLLEVDVKDGVANKLKAESSDIRKILRGERVRTAAPVRVDKEEPYINVTFKTFADEEAGLPLLEARSEPIDENKINSARTLNIENISELRYRVSLTDEMVSYMTERTINQSIKVLRDRIDPTGTMELTLAKEGSERILLQVPGADNEEVKKIESVIEKTAHLSFHEVKNPDSPLELQVCIEEQTCPPGTSAYLDEERGTYLLLTERPILTGADLKKSDPGLAPQTNQPIVNFTYNFAGANKFCDYTSEHVGELFAIVLDGKIISAPNIKGAICGGSGYIEGNFTIQSAKELALLLNAGALPAKLRVAYKTQVGPEMGADSIRAGKAASMLGLLGVALFMWLSYGLRFGTIANTALAINIVLIAGALSILGATLTLPGIAGIILTIGMAVDANVLIFERIREESALGRGPINAVDTGYRLSLAPILDANITTLIAALTLYFVGSGPIRGFAVTLAIGIVMSVFTAVVVARLMSAVWLRRARPKTLPI